VTDDEQAAEDAIPQDLRLRLPTPRVTLVLIALNVVAFVWSASRGAGWVVANADQLVAVGGNLPALTLNGEPWRIVTAMFLHGGLIHLTMNMICLWPGGQSAEYMFGRRSFVAIYLVAGLVGGLVSTFRTEMIVSVGASGAVFGVFGAILAYLLAHRDQLEPTVRTKQLKSLGTFMGLNLVLGVTAAGIDLAAHVGGLAAGFVIAYAGERGVDLSDPARARARRLPRIVVASVVAVALVGVGLATLPGPKVAYMSAAQAKSVEQLELRFKRFVTNEAELLAKQTELQQRAQNGEITAPELSRVITDELLPRWRALAVDLGKVGDLPSVIVPRQQAVVAYASARTAHLEAMVAMLALETEDPAFAAAQTKLEAKNQQIADALAALERAMK